MDTVVQAHDAPLSLCSVTYGRAQQAGTMRHRQHPMQLRGQIHPTSGKRSGNWCSCSNARAVTQGPQNRHAPSEAKLQSVPLTHRLKLEAIVFDAPQQALLIYRGVAGTRGCCAYIRRAARKGEVAMDAVTVLVDGLDGTKGFVPDFIAALHRECGSRVTIRQPTVPVQPQVDELLRAARATSDAMTSDESPADELISALGTVELLEVARLTCAAVQQAWCLSARSAPRRQRLNVCTNSVLWLTVQALHNDNLSCEFKAIAEHTEGIEFPGSSPVIHMYVGADAEVAAEYLARAAERNLRAVAVRSVEAAVEQTMALVHTPTVDLTQFM